MVIIIIIVILFVMDYSSTGDKCTSGAGCGAIIRSQPDFFQSSELGPRSRSLGAAHTHRVFALVKALQRLRELAKSPIGCRVEGALNLRCQAFGQSF